MTGVDEPNPFLRFMRTVHYVLDAPVVFIREKIVEPGQRKYPWYHEKFRRVPTIDECFENDHGCIYEANAQFLRDKLVDDEILSILRNRYEQCVVYNTIDVKSTVCEELYKIYKEASINWYIKYGELGPKVHVIKALMKEKHRLLWERRHGPVGQGVKYETSL